MDNRPLDQRCPWILNPEPHSAARREINLEPMDPGDVVEPDDTATCRKEAVEGD